MRRVLVISVIGAISIVLASACAKPQVDPRTPEITSATMMTGGATRVETPSYEQPPYESSPVEPTRNDLAERMADGLCEHERACGRGSGSTACVSRVTPRAHTELSKWNCSPAARRARVKDCLAAIRAETCELDMTRRATVCGPNSDCPSDTAHLQDPGPALAKIMRH
ncbi:DUF6184 family natural product biosynthesis lipoprotein [Labilithrix luteola]|nr:DUF6184 family natural product biosynthesis lipoprotein [Labilithrix luteola]